MDLNSREQKSLLIQETKNRLSSSNKTSNTKGKSENNKKTNPQKKIWSFDELVEAMKPSSKELEYRKKKRKESDVLQENSKLFRCTTCQKSFELILKKHQKVPTHPCLGVLMCQSCCDYYEDGEFSLDSDGEDKYCRWCGEGGTIFGCSKCICGFCATCIKRHFKPQFFKEIQKDDNWLCFFCDPKPLWDHRFICSLAVEMSENQETISTLPNSNKTEEIKNELDSSYNYSDQSSSFKDLGSVSKSKKKSSRRHIYSSSSDESDHKMLENCKKKFKLSNSLLEDTSEKIENDPVKNLKANALKELERVLKLSENQMNFGIVWSSKMLESLSDIDSKASQNELVNKCQKIKTFFSVFSAHLLHLSNSTDSLEKMISKNDGQKTHIDYSDKEKSPYITILQFLGFINNQVKTFMEKNISLFDVLEAEVYDDANVIGIKKKINSSRNIFDRDKSINPTEMKGSFRSEDYDDSESKEDTEELKIDEEDRSRDGSSTDIIMNEHAEMNFRESDDEYKDLNGSNVTSQEINDLKNTDGKDDIQEILAILENA